MDQQQLRKKLGEIEGKLIGIEEPRDKRIYLLCESENAYGVNKFVFEEVGARFCIVTGLDAETCFEVIYHYSYDQTGWVINIKAFVRDREKPSIESITSILPAAEWIEREIHDVLGINFANHPNLRRLILSDDWPEGVYPLRKEVVK